ncbi:acyl-CoA thioesterase [Martelella radicis]|uniref:Acyl-CoA thioester hydrolase n=1 Tax=Martelella radicis TaxID=1397476 RepID=A0A7W6KL94_9HYPH|nr:thioesterase family protein [Martelella radicis]MBB4122194.1 acyl-CoA thioester hydrolase [Martelella radicis]
MDDRHPERIELRVPYRDIDMHGRMHTAAYIEHAEEALAHFWRFRPEVENEPAYVVRKVGCTYYRGLRNGELAQLTVRAAKIGGKSIGFNVAVQTGNEIAAEIELLWSAVNRDSGDPAPLPEATRDWLYSFLD